MEGKGLSDDARLTKEWLVCLPVERVDFDISAALGALKIPKYLVVRDRGVA